jgi:ribose transport system substrate-binding protein
MKVFISYSRVDQLAARGVADVLRRQKIPFFLDEADIRWGDGVDATITAALDGVTHLVVLISPASVRSQWVAYEIGQARGRGIVVLPFLLHPSIDVPSFIADLNHKSRFDEIEEYFATTDGRAGRDPNRDLRLAVIPKGEALEFWGFVKLGAERAAAESPGVSIDWKNEFRESDSAGQNLAIEECVAEAYDGICVAAIHSTETRRAVDKAISGGLPVVVFDSGLADETSIVSYIATDNLDAGRQAAHKMAELLGNEGAIAVVRYKTGSRSTEERERGFLDATAAYPDMRIDDVLQISDDPRVIENVSERIARHGKQLRGVFCPIEFATMGVLAVRPRLSPDVCVVGFDVNVPIVHALRDGRLSAVVAQDPRQIGAKAVTVMVDYLRGVTVQPNYLVPCAIVTQRNIDAPGIQRVVAPT